MFIPIIILKYFDSVGDIYIYFDILYFIPILLVFSMYIVKESSLNQETLKLNTIFSVFNTSKYLKILNIHNHDYLISI